MKTHKFQVIKRRCLSLCMCMHVFVCHTDNLWTKISWPARCAFVLSSDTFQETQCLESQLLVQMERLQHHVFCSIEHWNHQGMGRTGQETCKPIGLMLEYLCRAMTTSQPSKSYICKNGRQRSLMPLCPTKLGKQPLAMDVYLRDHVMYQYRLLTLVPSWQTVSPFLVLYRNHIFCTMSHLFLPLGFRSTRKARLQIAHFVGFWHEPHLLYQVQSVCVCVWP